MVKFGTDSDDEADWTPWMISKKGLEQMEEYEGYEDEYSSASVTVLEYRPLSNQPEKPAEPEKSDVVYPSNQTITIDGKKVEFQMYSIKDEKGNDTNYVKIRDLALALKGTAAQFDVGMTSGAENNARSKTGPPRRSGEGRAALACAEARKFPKIRVLR
ncbi:MAG: hypothetical protein NC131_15815 [Roseburia sp.]|nr:hypothetical protein [Roseburia sp.]